MGALLIGSSTKGFTGMTVAQTPAEVEKGNISPGLQQLLSAIDDVAESGGPVEINIVVSGKERRVFTINVDNLGEIQEILQWTVGR
jgi:hypothetical protein